MFSKSELGGGMMSDVVYEIRNIYKTYKKGKIVANNDISLDVSSRRNTGVTWTKWSR